MKGNINEAFLRNEMLGSFGEIQIRFWQCELNGEAADSQRTFITIRVIVKYAERRAADEFNVMFSF